MSAVADLLHFKKQEQRQKHRYRDTGANSDTLTITQTGTGTLSGTGLTPGATAGTYTLTGTAATITETLEGLVFTSVNGVANTSVTTDFTLAVTDATAGTSSSTSAAVAVVDTDPPVAPTIAGTQASQTTTSEAPITPFSTATVSDTNNAGANGTQASQTTTSETTSVIDTNPAPAPTIADLDPTSQLVERLYYALLDRPADPGGLSYYDSLVQHHLHDPFRTIASDLIHSPEFQWDHGTPNNRDFVQLLYEGALGRSVEASALHHDVHVLQNGLTRSALAVSVAESPEAIGHLAGKPA